MPLENDKIAAHYPDYVDVWPTLRPGSWLHAHACMYHHELTQVIVPEEKGYTFDSEVNRMIRQFEQMRCAALLENELMKAGWQHGAH